MPRPSQRKPLQALPGSGQKSPSKVRTYLIRSLIFLFVLGGALGIGGGIALIVLYNRLPDVRQLENYTLPQANEIYTRSGRLLTRISSQGRYDPIRLEDIPKHVQDAVISAEDRRFREHTGVDVLGLARAAFVNLKHGGTVGGASTLTQQLIKNLFLTSERTAKRKIAEALLAIQLESKYSKPQILEMYLNLVFLGHNVYGVEAASQIYFGKSARRLSIAEAAMLAGIIRSPEYLSPHHHLEGAKKVQSIVLKQMAKDHLITEAQLDEALKQPIHLVSLRTSYPYPYFLDFVLYSLREKVGEGLFRQGGWKVYTTLDPEAQAYAERILREDLPRIKRYGAHQAALVSLDPRTGFIHSLVGGVNYAQSQFNRAFQAKRQVGSTFKPFVYLSAFENGKDLKSTLQDGPVSFGGYRPRNWDRRYHGTVTLLQALTMSMNIPTVKLANELGMGRVIDIARRAGVSSEIAPDLTSALGSSEMTLLELTAAYGSFANGGIRVEPTAIAKVVDAQGNILFDYYPPQQRVFAQSSVSQLNTALQNVINHGTGTAAAIGRPAAGKTGTTDQSYDTWFVGYVPQLVTGVWAGNDTPSATRGGGGSVCAPIWRSYMRFATRRLPAQGFEMVAPSSSPSASEASASPENSPTPSTPAIEISEIPLLTPSPKLPEDVPSEQPSEPPVQEPVQPEELPETTPSEEPML
ncbi:penicillin-binding protein [bacterium (Candidatus Blackallbacteria) CG17_big_fil_post_rev_8_21_14_2_50_48_46]|uniref:Penicillin-binding protein n=1 Tax=bacterium (Candidatus Blackallbacteria) CG17_big_fil_post_rev_8_21_14_2_50_48_46 TaxID=2014261 RepID=A0A2M7G3F3_9BACT|nr:MAG: penicillin-binding protein [bacterium (Candidatus Blackallbacteria) CG18_big_fil_WC_8_21_14_2_50_49_26]PIW16363.1 MAG: penicillin-binding protein [bacterium (Candidatus Blackallbacteria) CG17_big_fil_post_rev_8_21_14_2_50_48_46]PIW45377.1 MAG: penicillin-binding protein [bacterium (Candidatus Blackallbacteria) CG13_big_fil_rev_8_21_14_2_50_49_14]